AARGGATPDRVLDERRPVGRREVARRGGPDRMRQTGELALHPHELLRVLHRLFFGLGDVTALEIAAVLGAAGVAGLGRHAVVLLPDLLGRRDLGAERDVRIALARGPRERLLAERTGDPDAGGRLLARRPQRGS